MPINGEQNILKNLGDFFSPFMLFLHYAVFLRKQKMHKRRTKCTTLTHFEKKKTALFTAKA